MLTAVYGVCLLSKFPVQVESFLVSSYMFPRSPDSLTGPPGIFPGPPFTFPGYLDLFLVILDKFPLMEILYITLLPEGQ